MKQILLCRKTLLFAVLLFIPALGFTQVAQKWVASYNGPGVSHKGATAMVVDADGNVYVTGQSYLDDERVYYRDMRSEYATIRYSQTTCSPPTPAITVMPTSDVYTGGNPRHPLPGLWSPKCKAGGQRRGTLYLESG